MTTEQHETSGGLETDEGAVSTIGDKLRKYAEAIADASRGMIVVELDRAGELTATQLARRLDQTANNVYHHMRVLRQFGVVDPPRAVPGNTYVEKYYRINPELQLALRLDPEWYARVAPTLTVEARRELIISVMLTMAQLLHRSARDMGEMDVQTFAESIDQERPVSLSIARISRKQLNARLEALWTVLEQEDRAWAEDYSPRTELMLWAGLPGMFD
jgi:DNA-binding transcriptional ArsR family regulator